MKVFKWYPDNYGNFDNSANWDQESAPNRVDHDFVSVRPAANAAITHSTGTRER